MNSLKYFWWQGWIIIVGAVAMVVYSAWCGPGLTYDSHDYLAAAKSLSEQQELRNADGSPFLFHAPFFPIFIMILGATPLVKLWMANLLCFLLSLIFMRHILREQISSNGLFILCFISIAFAVGMQMIHHFIWSEPLFLMLFTLHNLLLIRYLQRRAKGDFYGLVGVAFLLAITRNAGFFVLLPSSIVLWWQEGRQGFRIAALYLIAGSAGFFAWNVHVTMMRDGVEKVYQANPFLTGWWENLVNYGDTISTWFLPALLPLAIRLLLVLAACLVIFYHLKKTIRNRVVTLLGVQSLFYIITMIVLLSVDQDEIERLLAIVYPWVIGALCMIADRMYQVLGSGAKKILLVGLLLWTSYVVVRGVHNNQRWHRDRCVEQVTSDLRVVGEYAME